jgi:hypothetical protein
MGEPYSNFRVYPLLHYFDFFCEKDFLLLKQQDYNRSSIVREYQRDLTQTKFENAPEYDQSLPTHGLHYFAHG